MKLWYAPTSPFARKVRIAAAELGLDTRIALVPVDPWTDARLRALNPLAKVPVLELEDGATLFESAVICDYLDALQPPRRLIPPQGADRWRALRLQGLADGAMTAVGRLYADERRRGDAWFEAMIVRFREARDATLDELDAAQLHDHPSIGEIAVAAYLGYLDFRWPHRDWRAGRPVLATWFDRFSERPSMTNSSHASPSGDS